MALRAATGRVFEVTAVPALEMNGYSVKKQAYVGEKLGGGRHRVDALVTTPETPRKLSERILVSSKWQQTSGTAEEKVPFEVIKLLHTLACEKELDGTAKYARAYIVLGGDGWKLKSFYLGDAWRHFMKDTVKVTIVTLDEFITRANRRTL